MKKDNGSKMKNKIALIKLGYVGCVLNIEFIKKWQSDLFEINQIDCIEHLPDASFEDGYLDQKYKKEDLVDLINCPNHSDFAVAIMPYRFVDNFYMHRIKDKCVVISLYGISEILSIDNISMENFIIKQLYEICSLRYLVSDISSDDVYSFVHRDTRGCIFDMNGERSDIIFNTEKPKICDECRGVFKKKQINTEVVSKLERELKRIKKPWILQVEKYIKNYPLVSIIFSGLIAICLNLFASFIWELLKPVLQSHFR